MKKNVTFIQVVICLLVFCIAFCVAYTASAQVEDVENREDVKLIRKIQSEYTRFKDQGYDLYGLIHKMALSNVDPYNPEQNLRACNALDRDIVKVHKLLKRLKRTLKRCQKLENKLRSMESVYVTSFLAIIDSKGGILHNLRITFQEMKAEVLSGVNQVKRGCEMIRNENRK